MTEELPKGRAKATLGEIRCDASLAISAQQMRGEIFELYSVPSFKEGEPEIISSEAIGSNKIWFFVSGRQMPQNVVVTNPQSSGRANS